VKIAQEMDEYPVLKKNTATADASSLLRVARQHKNHRKHIPTASLSHAVQGSTEQMSEDHVSSSFMDSLPEKSVVLEKSKLVPSGKEFGIHNIVTEGSSPDKFTVHPLPFQADIFLRSYFPVNTV
jgi:hypothetical protein